MIPDHCPDQVFYTFDFTSQVFDDEQEQELRDYLLKAAKLFYGLGLTELRTLAFEFAKTLTVAGRIKKIPKAWIPIEKTEQPMATRDWADGFIKRHPELSLRRPVSTSLGRAAAFNPTVVHNFFDLYEKVLESYQFSASTVWNMDETGLNTVHKTKFVLAKKGQRCVAAASSGERGVNVTLTMAVSAAGEKIPPFFIFPRAKMQDKFLLHGSADAKGVANGSGWQTADTFLQFLHHFKDHAIKAGTKKTLLILDNHESHMTIAGLKFCKENDIEVLTLPPHTSHKLQPLDKGVFGPLKTYFNNSCKTWMFNHPNVPITIDHVAELVAEPINKGASSLNIISGFKASGIWPFNRDIFSEDDFLASSVTDRPYADEACSVPATTSSEPEIPGTSTSNRTIHGKSTPDRENPTTSTSHSEIPVPSVSNPLNTNMHLDVLKENLDQTLSLETIRPLPKAAARKASSRGRKRRRAALITDPEMMESLRSEQEEAAQKKSTQAVKKQLAAERKIEKEIKKRQKESESVTAGAAKIIGVAATKTATKRPRGRPIVTKPQESNSGSDKDADEVILKYKTKRHR